LAALGEAPGFADRITVLHVHDLHHHMGEPSQQDATPDVGGANPRAGRDPG
jgi:hypothetical protein